MKTNKLLFLVTFLLLSTTILKAQTKSETVEWLTEKLNNNLEGVSFLTSNSLMRGSDIRVSNITCKQIKIKLKVSGENNGKNFSHSAEYIIPLKNLEVKNAKLLSNFGKYGYSFFLNNSSASRNIKLLMNGRTLRYDSSGLIKFPSDDSELIRKLNKAITHLNKVCNENDLFND